MINHSDASQWKTLISHTTIFPTNQLNNKLPPNHPFQLPYSTTHINLSLTSMNLQSKPLSPSEPNGQQLPGPEPAVKLPLPQSTQTKPHLNYRSIDCPNPGISARPPTPLNSQFTALIN